MDQEKIVRRDTVGQRLSLEIGTRVMLTFNGTNASVRGRFVGMDPGAYLVVSLPSVTDLNGVLTEKRPAALKFVAGGMVYGFQAFIIEHFQKQNLHLLILSYPDKVRRVRSSGRKKDGLLHSSHIDLGRRRIHRQRAGHFTQWVPFHFRPLHGRRPSRYSSGPKSDHFGEAAGTGRHSGFSMHCEKCPA